MQNGEIFATKGRVEDITDRKRAELEQQVTTKIIHSMSATHNLDDLLRFDSCRAERSALRGKLFRGALRGVHRHVPFSLSAWTSTIHRRRPSKIERSCTDYVFRTGQPMIITQAGVRSTRRAR